MLKVFIGLLTVGYPFLVDFAIDAVQPRYLALLLTVFFLLRWLQQGHGGKGAGAGPAILVPASVLYLLTVGFDQRRASAAALSGAGQRPVFRGFFL